MSRKIYIIGTIPRIIDKNSVFTFNKAESKLLKMGLKPINPISQYTNAMVKPKEAKLINLMSLINADGVYILDVKSVYQNEEIKIAVKLNLLLLFDLL